MKYFDELWEIATRLNSPQGCPWDRSQTFEKLRAYVLEEAHEVVEAVDSNENQKIIEELGDLFYTVLFYAKIAEREGRFELKDILCAVKEKLIRRHPHVFGELKLENEQEVLREWEKIKRREVAHEKRESALDGIPIALPALARAQKMVGRMERAGFSLPKITFEEVQTEEALGDELLALVREAAHRGVDAEGALRRALGRAEQAFRAWEKKSSGDGS